MQCLDFASRDVTMGKLALLLFLPISLHAMVLLSPSDKMDFGDDIHADQNLEAILHRLYNGDYLSVEEAELFDNDANPSTIEHLSILDLVPRPIVEDKLRWNGAFLQGSADSDLVHGIDSPRFVKTDVLYRDIVKSQHTPNKRIRNVHNSNGKAQWNTGGNEYTRENNGIDVRPDNVDSWLMEGDAIHQVQGRTAQERQWNTMVANEFISRDAADVWERKTGHSKRAKDSTFQGRDSRSQREYDEDSEELEKDVDSKGPCMSDDDSADVEIDATDNTNYYDNVKTSGEDNTQRVTTPRTTKNTKPLADYFDGKDLTNMQLNRDARWWSLGSNLVQERTVLEALGDTAHQRKRRSPRSPEPGNAQDGRNQERERKRSRDSQTNARKRLGDVKQYEPVEAMVEVLVVVENSIYRKFLSNNNNNREAALARIRRYYGIVFAMMDERFQTILDPMLSISVKISGILIAEKREDSGWLEILVDWKDEQELGRASVNTDYALRNFSIWIKTHHAKLPKFDHAMIFSGYRLTNKLGVSFGGKAYLGAICDITRGNSVSIVADNGDFQCIKVAAHELAHSLGSVHDGDPGPAQNCPSSDNYVMASVASHAPENLKNAFYFSPCSIRQMRKLLRSKKASCVRDTPTVFYSYDIYRLPPGKLISPDQHCQMIYGRGSTFCQEKDVVKLMCGQLWCRDPEVGNACRTNSYLTALPGTPCAEGMSCHLGECLPESESKDTQTQVTERVPSLLESSLPYNHVPGSVRHETQLENTIPTLPQSVIRGRVGRRTNNGATQASAENPRTIRQRSKPKQTSPRRRGRCKPNQADKNGEYCRGLVALNPDACRRYEVRNYCCQTCG